MAKGGSGFREAGRQMLTKLAPLPEHPSGALESSPEWHARPGATQIGMPTHRVAGGCSSSFRRGDTQESYVFPRSLASGLMAPGSATQRPPRMVPPITIAALIMIAFLRMYCPSSVGA